MATLFAAACRARQLQQLPIRIEFVKRKVAVLGIRAGIRRPVPDASTATDLPPSRAEVTKGQPLDVHQMPISGNGARKDR
jgi:hypothetical protein